MGARVDMKPFQVGQILTIVPDLPELGDMSGWQGYPVRVEQVRDDGLLVSMPSRKALPAALAVDGPVIGFFQRAGSRYRFRAVVGALAETPVPMLLLRQVEEVRRLERRSTVRTEVCLQPLEIALLEGATERPPDVRSTVVVNVSAGGLGLVCRRPIPVGTMVRVTLELPAGFGRVEAVGEVVRCSRSDVQGLEKWRIGLAFREISEEQRDRVAAFVFSQQQMLRRRGLL